MDFNSSYSLEDERVLMVPLTLEHIVHLLPFSINEPELWDYSLTPGNGEENLKKYIQQAVQTRTNQTAYPFLVFDKKTQQWAGSTRFYDIQKQHATTQLGYTWYGKHFQGTGLNAHCKYLMLSFAFEQMKVERVEFRADANNKRSINAMKKLGCVIEGILRSNCQGVGRRRDSIVLSILKEEWYSKVKANLEERLRQLNSITK